MLGLLDTAAALRLIYLLQQPIKDTKAYKLGLIDLDGKILKKATTAEEKSATSMLHRLVWSIKKIISIAPGGNTRLAGLTAAYLLMKESIEQKMSIEESIEHVRNNFDRVHGLEFAEKELVEEVLMELDEDTPANATGPGTSTDQAAIKPRRFAKFNISDKTFDKFKEGDAKFRKWSSYLNVEDATEKKIVNFARNNPKSIMLLKDTRGNTKAVRYSKRGTDHWAELKKTPVGIAESLIYDELEVLSL